MLYIIWGLLNLGLFIYFLVICYKAVKLLRENMGVFAAIFFAVGILSIIGHTNADNYSNKPHSPQVYTWNSVSEDSLIHAPTSLMDVELGRSLISRNYLNISYGMDKQGKYNIPYSAYSSTTGVVSGTEWIPKSIMVGRTDDNRKFQYCVIGVVEWKLFGITLFSQSKRYQGMASIQPENAG